MRESYTYSELSDATYRFELTLKNGDTVIGDRVAFDINREEAKKKVASMLDSYDWKTMRILHHSEVKWW